MSQSSRSAERAWQWEQLQAATGDVLERLRGILSDRGSRTDHVSDAIDALAEGHEPTEGSGRLAPSPIGRALRWPSQEPGPSRSPDRPPVWPLTARTTLAEDLAAEDAFDDPSHGGCVAGDLSSAAADYPDPPDGRLGDIERRRKKLAVEMGIWDSLPSARRLWSPEEFADIYAQSRDGLWRHLASQVGSDLADDLTGETFMRAWTSQHTFDPEEGTVGAWLYGIAGNLVRSRWRELARYQEAMARLAGREDPEAQEELHRERERFLDNFHQDSATETARRVLERLTPAQRDVMTLHYIYELTYSRVSELLDMSVATVRSHVHRGRRRADPSLEDQDVL